MHDIDTQDLLRKILYELQCSRFEAAERHNATVDAIAAERERCAKIAEDLPRGTKNPWAWLMRIAAAIRKD